MKGSPVTLGCVRGVERAVGEVRGAVYNLAHGRRSQTRAVVIQDD